MRRWPLLLLIPLVDALLLVVVATQFLGAVTTVALVVLTGLVGMLLVRAEGRRTIGRIRDRLVAGELPADELLDGAFLVAAGAFLLTPGLVTDVIGFSFVLPPTRVPIRRLLKRYVVTPYVEEQTDGFATGTVYTAGFPREGFEGGIFGGSNSNSGSGPGSGPSNDDIHDLDPDAYEVDIDDGTDD
jgi:UPF0716 protein FxsA